MPEETLGVLDQPVKELVDGQVLELLQFFGFVCAEELMEETPMRFEYFSVRHERETPINSHANDDDFRFVWVL
jgi:hypothetical protein